MISMFYADIKHATYLLQSSCHLVGEVDLGSYKRRSTKSQNRSASDQDAAIVTDS